MGIRNMEWGEWLQVHHNLNFSSDIIECILTLKLRQLDNRFPAYHAIKVHRIATQGDKVVRTLPTSLGIPSGTLAGQCTISLFIRSICPKASNSLLVPIHSKRTRA
jgi:hypothetical protein